MGLDVGSKRIGLALSDELGITAQAFSTLSRTTEEKDINKLLTIARENKVEKIVVGLPKNMDGSIGKSAQKILAFVQRLKNVSRIHIEFWDERLSTVAVNRTLIEANLSRRRRKEVTDKLAAAYILQGYLDKKNFNSSP
jgi:putative Holliday junction resolvase